jgi:hypothetical protein
MCGTWQLALAVSLIVMTSRMIIPDCLHYMEVLKTCCHFLYYQTNTFLCNHCLLLTVYTVLLYHPSCPLLFAHSY